MMGIRMDCACGKKVKIRTEQIGRGAKCPSCGQLLRANHPSDEVNIAYAEASESVSKNRKREMLLWAGFGAGLLSFAIISINIINKQQRVAANREVSMGVAEASSLLRENRHDEAISLLESLLHLRNATALTDARRLREEALVAKKDFLESKFISNIEKSIEEGRFEYAVDSLATRSGAMSERNRSRANSIISDIKKYISEDIYKSRLREASDEELADAETLVEAWAAVLPTKYRAVRERYRRNLVASLPAERARREELSREAEALRLASLERERLQKLENERIAREAEEAVQLEKRKLAEAKRAKEAIRLAAEERRRRAFRGFGQEATPSFSLSEGLAVVILRHRGSANFIVTLLDAQGKTVELLANVIGSCSISRAIRIDGDGDHLLNVKADGAWEVVIHQPLPHQTDYKFFFDGYGTAATEQFRLLKGVCRVKFKHIGSANFIVHVLDDEGRRVEVLANEIGNHAGSQALTVENSGTYIFDITADGRWSIELD